MIISYEFLEYALIRKNGQCVGKRKHMGYKDSQKLCATACEEFSEMFNYGASDGTCYCQVDTNNYRCKKETFIKESDLYAFQNRSK